MKSFGNNLSRSLSFSALFKRLSSSSRRVNPEGIPPLTSVNGRPNNVSPLQLTELIVSPSANNTQRSQSSQINQSSQRNQPDPNPIVVADLGFSPNPDELNLELAHLNTGSPLNNESKREPVTKKSEYESSPFIPFDHRESQSTKSPDNLHSQPRYNDMIFFDPEENSDSLSDIRDQRRKKFLTVISSANSILPHASPSTSPGKQTEISNDDIQNTYQQSLIKMKVILIEIENSGYSKNEIIEACQYARQFKGIMNGRDGVIGELRNKYSALDENKIKEKFEKLKTISFLFQQECFKKDIFSGRDENSLKSQYKFANGKNNRPGLRLAYIPDEAFEMYKRHNEAAAVELSARPVAARMGPPGQMI